MNKRMMPIWTVIISGQLVLYSIKTEGIDDDEPLQLLKWGKREIRIFSTVSNGKMFKR